MARSSRPARPLINSVQAHLALPHGAVSWHAFPLPVREQVVALWIELLRSHMDASAEEVSS
ncbi:hypothetical protein [Gemmatimonas sp.]|uniref:hypothetical protein n=1 Tax=Gemmatimonas sp. TaxID=1962908 RepID=UPI00286B5678|nr:hypothetical protein [Gemmatimonas sp.]